MRTRLPGLRRPRAQESLFNIWQGPFTAWVGPFPAWEGPLQVWDGFFMTEKTRFKPGLFQSPSAKKKCMFQAWKSSPQATKSPLSRLQRARQGCGQLAPTTWKLWGAAPQLWTVNVVHFYFVCFCTWNLGLSQKNSGAKSGEFLDLDRGYRGPQETFAPPPQLQSISAPMGPVWSLREHFKPKSF